MILEKFLALIQQKIAEMNYGNDPHELYEPIQYLMDLGGKRLRPALTLLGASLYTKNWEQTLLPAIGIEVFHNFTLMHDDIMDKAPIRRGKPTVHAKWNESVAILSGDVMLVKAYELMIQVPDKHLRSVIQSFNKCASEVCEGQQMDMSFENKNDVTENEYLEMIRRKTAVLLGFALALGGILADAPQEDIHLLRDLGENMGIGFQLKDDLLDVFGDADKVGKQVGGDIVANKKTYLLIEAQERANKAQAQLIQDWLANHHQPTEKVEAIKAIYQELDIEAITQKKIQHFFDLSYTQLALIKLPESQKQSLKDFMDWLIDREH